MSDIESFLMVVGGLCFRHQYVLFQRYILYGILKYLRFGTFFFLRKKCKNPHRLRGIVLVRREDDRTAANQSRKAEDGKGPAVLFTNALLQG